MKTVLAIQARLGSTRLPQKVLQPIYGRPLVLFMAERLRRARTVDQVVVTTTSLPSDDLLAAELDAVAVSYYRGAVDDIVARLLGTVERFAADVLVRVWGDAPYTDPATVDAALALLHDERADFVSTCLKGRFLATGLDLEVYRATTLRRIAAETADVFYREFPVDYIRQASPPFCARQLDLEPTATTLNISVDYQDDLELVRAIDEACSHDASVSSAAVIELVRGRPELLAIAERHARNVDYERKKQATRT